MCESGRGSARLGGIGTHPGGGDGAYGPARDWKGGENQLSVEIGTHDITDKVPGYFSPYFGKLHLSGRATTTRNITHPIY